MRAGGADAHFLELDVTKPQTVAKAAEQIRTQYGKLDILVNNAGVVDKGDGPPSVADPDAVRRVLDVNFFGVLAVTQAMLPLVRNAESGRIVMVSSGPGLADLERGSELVICRHQTSGLQRVEGDFEYARRAACPGNCERRRSRSTQ